MLDERYIEAYKSVKAGDELKNRIIAQAEETCLRGSKTKGSFIKSFTAYAAAACAVLIVGVGIFAHSHTKSEPVSVYYSGVAIREEAVTIVERGAQAVSFGTKSVTTSGLPLEIKVSDTAKISVTDGEMQIFDKDTDELLFIGTDFTADKTVIVYWNLADATETEPSLIVGLKNEYSVYTLEESEKLGYTIRLTETKTN
ncbi:MAG: hypothetical protein IJ499_00340 [Clostridia bacterium]|nr:hypothetical protein [Clostridia bacterium]